MKSKTKSSRGRSILAHTVLILLSFMCLFFFYVLIINATRSHAELVEQEVQKFASVK